MRARHYDPTIGRFLSEDPIWSTNLYPYAENSPIMKNDPKGEEAGFGEGGIYNQAYIDDWGKNYGGIDFTKASDTGKKGVDLVKTAGYQGSENLRKFWKGVVWVGNKIKDGVLYVGDQCDKIYEKIFGGNNDTYQFEYEL